MGRYVVPKWAVLMLLWLAMRSLAAVDTRQVTDREVNGSCQSGVSHRYKLQVEFDFRLGALWRVGIPKVSR